MARIPAPMLATAGPVPADDDDRYVYEFKFDGIRCLTAVSDGACRMISRNANVITSSFPEIAAALQGLATGREMILDGELVTPDSSGVPRFARIGRRLGVMRPSQTLLREVPAQYFVFDILALDGVDLRGLGYLERRDHLAQLALPHGPIRISPYYADVPVSRMLAVAAEHGMEGAVGKLKDSTYRPGRAAAWRKLPLRQALDVVVVGWLPGGRGGGREFGSLLIGAHERDGRLTLLGAVGTGFTDRARQALHQELLALATPWSPVAGTVPPSIAASARWVRPHLVGEVACRVSRGSSLRHASWRGLRFDRTPAQVFVPDPDS